jgi:hypothetical protein
MRLGLECSVALPIIPLFIYNAHRVTLNLKAAPFCHYNSKMVLVR